MYFLHFLSVELTDAIKFDALARFIGYTYSWQSFAFMIDDSMSMPKL